MKALWWLVVLALVFLAGFRLGATYAQNQSGVEIASLQASLAEQDRLRALAIAKAQALYQAELISTLRTGKSSERDFLNKQQQLIQQQKALKERLDEATANSANSACTLSPGWVQHYRQALGINRVPTAHANGAGDSRGVADAAITTTELLRHAAEYGHWCQSNFNQLTALQRLIKGQPHDDEQPKWTY